MASPARIDTHQHLIPPAYRKLLDERGLTAGGWPNPDWDPQAAIAMMDRESIATGILSLSAPGVHLADDAEGRTLARQVNEYHAELVKGRPHRFGQFACIPLPDVDGAVAEAVHALDVLHADGVVLLSNAGGKYLGDPDYETLWAELDARSAVVFIHPTEPPIQMLKGLPSPLLDYPFDTTRTAIHMVANGVMSRRKRIKVILSHGGGFLPYAAYRFVGAAQFNPGTSLSPTWSVCGTCSEWCRRLRRKGGPSSTRPANVTGPCPSTPRSGCSRKASSRATSRPWA